MIARAAALALALALLAPADAAARSRVRHHHHHGGGTVVVTHGHTRARVVAPIRTRIVVATPPVVEPRLSVRVASRIWEPMYLGHDALDRALLDLDRAGSEDERIAVVLDVARRYTLASWQARELAGRLLFGASRVDALATLYPRIYDPSEFFAAADALLIPADRARLRALCFGADRAQVANP